MQPSDFTTEQKIDAWFEAHFNNITPGTPMHYQMTEAVKNLKVMLVETDGIAPPKEAPQQEKTEE